MRYYKICFLFCKYFVLFILKENSAHPRISEWQALEEKQHFIFLLITSMNTRLKMLISLLSLSFLMIGWATVWTVSAANRDTNLNPKTNHEQMLKAIESGDYTAWKQLQTMSGWISQYITKDNFATFAEMHKAMLSGDLTKAEEIRTKLGLPCIGLMWPGQGMWMWFGKNKWEKSQEGFGRWKHNGRGFEWFGSGQTLGSWSGNFVNWRHQRGWMFSRWFGSKSGSTVSNQ